MRPDVLVALLSAAAGARAAFALPPTALRSVPTRPRPVLLCAGGGGETSGGETDFSGKWEMDLKASEKLGPLLRELGVPGLLASVITRLKVRQSIVQDSAQVTIDVATAASKDTLELKFDGAEVRLKGITGGSTAAVSRWLDGGKMLETRQCLTEDAALPPSDPRADVFVTVRSLVALDEGGVALLEDCSVLRAGAPVPQAAARRLLRRVG